MDPSEEGLCHLILDGGGLPPDWRDEPLFHECLSELTACGLEKLTNEPRRLDEAHRRLQDQNQELASSNYKTFIRTAECSKEIAHDFTIVEAQLEELLSRIPTFSANCETFMTDALEISAARRLTALTLMKHTQVLEILEIPQLMDTCVRNSHCDEALELVNYVKRLERKHNNIPMVASVVREVRRSTQALLHKLVGQLKGELKLPTCLKVIGYLRRMDVFSERELRLKFLQARDVWLTGLLQSIPREDAFHHISKVIEVTRVTIFDVITQFRAVFSDDDPLVISHDWSGGPIAHESALFHSWLCLKISQFLATLEADLMRGGDSMASRFDTLLGQCMYFGLSFGRVGCDFRGRLPQIFQSAILYHFRGALDAAVRDFEEAINRYSFCLPMTSSRGTKVLSDAHEVPPPHELLAFPPLSLLTNHLLTALNRLRLCASLNLCREVVNTLNKSLTACVRAVCNLHRVEGSAFSVQEVEAFGQLCEAMASQLFPHINLCLSHLFPQRDLSAYLGLSRLEVERQRIGCLDLSVLTEPLKPFLPQRKAIEEKLETEPFPSIAVENAEIAAKTNENVVAKEEEKQEEGNNKGNSDKEDDEETTRRKLDEEELSKAEEETTEIEDEEREVEEEVEEKMVEGEDEDKTNDKDDESQQSNDKTCSDSLENSAVETCGPIRDNISAEIVPQ